MTEKYKSLETTIREAARKAMQEKTDKIRLTTEVMEPKDLNEEVLEEGKAIKTMRSHSDYGRFLSEHPEVGYVARHHVDAPSPYRYSPTDTVMNHKGKNVVVREVSHRKYEVHPVPEHAKIHDNDADATEEHIMHLKGTKEEVETLDESDTDAAAIALGWSKNKYGKWAHPEFPGAGYIKSKHAVEDTPDYRKENKRKADKKNEEFELDEMETVKNKGDHDVLKAFANKQSHQSKKLSTDGTTLHGNWMGGHSIAAWDGDKVRFRGVSSRSEQAVHRALRKKHLAPNDIHEEAEQVDEAEFGKRKQKPVVKKPIKAFPIPSKPFKEEEEIEEAMPGQTDPMKDKMAQQKAQVQKQKDQIRMQLAQQKAAKQEQAMKAKGEKSLEKIKEAQGFDKLYVVHLKNETGQVSKHETFASNEKAAIKLAHAKKAKALVPTKWSVHKVDKLSEDDELDELSHETLGNYITKAGGRQGVHMAAYKRMKNIVRDNPATTKRGRESHERALKNQHARATSKPMTKPVNESEELNERFQKLRVRNFGRASKLQKLHALRYSRLAASGDLAKAELHRKRAIEYKRLAYQAKDNPDKIPGSPV